LGVKSWVKIIVYATLKIQTHFWNFRKKMLLNHYLEKQEVKKSLADLLVSIARAGKYVAHAIRTGDLGLAGTSNLFGENQLELDVLADKIFTNHLERSGLVNEIASEEQEDSIVLSPSGKYSVAFDPLDGSSLVSSNLTIGAIFGIFKAGGFEGRTGDDLVAACYLIFGPRTVFVLTVENLVLEFSMNELGEFVITNEKVKIKSDASTFSPGNLRALVENKQYAKLIDDWQQRQLTLRYSGGMVPDIHAIFAKKGGIFAYPPFSRYPQGKLRLLFECAPFALIAEKAGGLALNSTGERVLDVAIDHVHQRTPIIIGSKSEVERALQFLIKGKHRQI
jgi:fructose-1,6-bisphosphatase I